MNPSREGDFGISGAPSVNTINVTFDSPQAAQAAISSSPLVVDLRGTGKSNPPNNANTGDDANAAAAETNTDATPLQDLKPRPGTSIRHPRTMIRCSITESKVDHVSAAKRNPFSGTFNPYMRSPVYKGLVDILDKRLKGLADCSTARKTSQPPNLSKASYDSASAMGGGSLFGLWKQRDVWQRKGEAEVTIPGLIKKIEELQMEIEIQGPQEDKTEEIAELERQIEQMEKWDKKQKQAETRQGSKEKRLRAVRNTEKKKAKEERMRKWREEKGQEESMGQTAG